MYRKSGDPKYVKIGCSCMCRSGLTVPSEAESARRASAQSAGSENTDATSQVGHHRWRPVVILRCIPPLVDIPAE